MKKQLVICGGGSSAHTIIPFLKDSIFEVSVFTSQPEKWAKTIELEWHKRILIMVSIIIPFYNRKEYVRVMVDSIIAQKYKDWELIMVDDGSSDGSFEMLEEYHKIDSRILLFHRDSNLKGANVCRNIGLRVSHGEYVIFLDSDDWIPDYCLENRVMFMEKNRNLDFNPCVNRNFRPI